MPSKTPRQHRAMEAAAHDPAMAKKLGIPPKVGREFVMADIGRKFIAERSKQKADAK